MYSAKCTAHGKKNQIEENRGLLNLNLSLGLLFYLLTAPCTSQICMEFVPGCCYIYYQNALSILCKIGYGGAPVNPWMVQLQDKLAAEGILSDPSKVLFVPQQYYADTVDEFIDQLKGFVGSARHNGKDLTVFVDGIPKQCSEKNGTDIDRAVRDALNDAGLPFDWVILSERLGVPAADLHASHLFVEKTRDVVRVCRPGICMVLGSGSITDIVKQALFLEDIKSPFISVPTALTVTAFTSAFSVIDLFGAKRTQLSREIAATFWIRSILECAPPRMSRAGYGDLLARFVAYGDWYLGKRLGVMDRYDETAFRLMEPFVKGIKGSAEGFAQHPLPEETIMCISASLAMAGIAMSVSGETTPLSGFEHVISHGLDFLRLTSERELVFHGEQVALGCLTSARAIDWLIAQNSIDGFRWLQEPENEGLNILNDLIFRAPLLPTPDRIEKARQEFIREYMKKSGRWKEELALGRIDTFTKEWPEIRDNLARLTQRTAEIDSLMRLAGLPLAPDATTPPTSDDEYEWAVRFSPFVRSRMNVSDLIFWMGEDAARFIYKPGRS
jgi:glycerol-1-phosphate dehydrogenase [NAD(P)+]